MSRNYERDERERWRRQQQREDDYGWRRDEDYGRPGREDMNEEFGGRRYWGENRGRDRGWDRGLDRGWNQGMQGQYTGRGPRNYKRPDNRIEEDINEQLTRHAMIDATDVEVSVQNGEVTLRGHVDSRYAKRLTEDIAESTFGVKEVNNQIKIQHYEEPSGRQRERRVS